MKPLGGVWNLIDSASDYSALLVDVKNRIRTAQIRASLSVNRELIQLYWDIGHLIVERQRAQGWGRSVVERLAADIQKGFPGMAGFSQQNIWKMRGFFLAWTAEVRNLSQAMRESRRHKFLSQLAREIDGGHLPRVAAELVSPARKSLSSQGIWVTQ